MAQVVDKRMVAERLIREKAAKAAMFRSFEIACMAFPQARGGAAMLAMNAKELEEECDALSAAVREDTLNFI